MRPIGLRVPDAIDSTSLRRSLCQGLEQRGDVVAINREAPVGDGGTATQTTAVPTYRLDEDGRWSVTGEEHTLDSLLDRLAPTYDYAVLDGFPDADVPEVAVGSVDVEEPLYAVDSIDAVDTDAVIDALDDTEPYETLESLVTRIKQAPNADRAGAIATFTGRVREKDADDDTPTTHLAFEKYDTVADERMRTIETELEERDGVQAVLLHHRTGVIEAGEDIVFVVVLAGHREEAFRTVEDGINRLKDEVPLFKKEITVEETFWRHEAE
ncbi:MAG: molybdopterin synthase [Halobacteriales archaeon]|nr:molybdopterin synthase [Halobacteriales archaeon]